MRYIFYFFRTLYDVGFKRILGRLLYEIKIIFLKFLPEKIIIFIFNIDKKTPKYKEILNTLNNVKISKRGKFINPSKITFSFLNQKETLAIPIQWNSNKYSQLWRFNLHYFEWYREFLEIKLRTGKWPYNSRLLKLLINDWIDNNKLGIGDGWHSYTISIRIRNWIIFFRICPDLLNQKIIDSMWKQICWLYSNKEDYIGGNHWLENLISLLIGSLQFEGKKSKEIFEFSFKNLEKELSHQLLKDGGHFERSASYHLLILERLIELGLILENTNGLRPYWLISSIRKMMNWTYSVKLNNGKFPIFNDNPEIPFDIDSIINYGISYLNKKNIPKKGIKNILTKIYNDSYENNFQLKESGKNKYLTKLIDTGWIIARDNKGLELILKIGDSCPKYLPAHTHSDLLSFDLFKNGIPIIIETGTSVYGNNKDRYYERSAAAHNIFQLAPFKGDKKNDINWIEPIEVWGNFRAARKAKVLEKSCGYNLKEKTIWIRGSNDVHLRYRAKHIRSISLKISCENKTQLNVLDEVTCYRKMHWRQFWHLGPEQCEDILGDMISKLKNKFEFEEKWLITWYSIGFGKRVKRKTLRLSGVIDKGIHKFNNKLVI